MKKLFNWLYIFQLLGFALMTFGNILHVVNDRAWLISALMMLLFAIWHIEEKMDEGIPVRSHVDIDVMVRNGEIVDATATVNGKPAHGGQVARGELDKDKMN